MVSHFSLNCNYFSVSVLENRQATDEEIIDKYCFYVRYEIPEKSGSDWSNDYLARIRKLGQIRKKKCVSGNASENFRWSRHTNCFKSFFSEKKNHFMHLKMHNFFAQKT